MGKFQKNGNWYIDYYVSGRRKREMIGPSKKLAEEALRARLTQRKENKIFDIKREEKIKFEDFAQEYLNNYSKLHKKSWITDAFRIKDLSEFFKGKFLYEIIAKDIERFKMERLKKTIGETGKTVSPSTVNRDLGTLRGIFNKAVAWEKLQTSPMKSVKFLREPPGRLRFLETEEIAALLSNCSPQLRPIVVLALFTGMRRGEILGLKWRDFDFKRRIITLLNTKNGQKREVPMSDTVNNALLQIKEHPESPYVFCFDNGQPRQDIRTSFSTVLKKSGITNFHFHDLRHTFASQLVMSGVDLNTVRELLGHKDITMTLRYSHLAPRHKQHAVDILSEKMDTFWTLDPKTEKSEKTDITQVIRNI